jgi:hypothetical protein
MSPIGHWQILICAALLHAFRGKADMTIGMSAFAVAIGGKADMAVRRLAGVALVQFIAAE